MGKRAGGNRCRLMIAAGVLLAAIALSGQAPPATVPSPPAAAPSPLEALLATHSYDIALTDGRLSGAGAGFLYSELADTQFLALGEQHNNLFIPDVTAAIFQELHRRHGFNYLATEQDPVTMRAVSQRPLRGDLRAIGAAAKAEPYSFTFITDQELKMLADIGRISTGKHRPIWGCEQAFGATHILRRLSERARTPAARDFIRSFQARATAAEAKRDQSISTHFIARTELRQELTELERHFPRPDAETAFLLRSLKMSSEIYGYYRAGDRKELPGYWSNSKVREEYMKEVCAAEYKAALAADRTLPKVVLKYGQWHLYETHSPANITTLGTFFSQTAKMNGTGYASVYMMTSSWDGTNVWDADGGAFTLPFKSVLAGSGWRLVDLRPFREYPNFRLLAGALDPKDVAARAALTRLVYGFDFLLSVGAGANGTYEAAGVAPAPK